MEMIDQYSEAYINNGKIDGYDAKSLLTEVTIWFVPMVNPDGVTLQQSGLKAFPTWMHPSLIKMNNGSTNFKGWKANAQGIDLNRQYPARWTAYGAIKQPFYMNYPGTRALQAPEAAMLAAFTYWVDPEITISYHSSGRILFWDYLVDKANYNRDYTIAKEVGDMTGYRLVMPTGTPSGSGYKDWFISTFKRPGLTPEISYYVGETNPPISVFDEEWKRNKAVGLYLAQESNSLWENKLTHVNRTITTLDTKATLNRPDANHTSYGMKWVNDSSTITEDQSTKIDKNYELVKPKVAHSIPSGSTAVKSIPVGTILKATREWKDWTSVIYDHQTYWLRTDGVLQPFTVLQSTEPIDQELVLVTRKTLFTLPSFGSNTTESVEPMIISATRQRGNWYAVNTVYGERWISNASVLTDFQPTEINQQYKLSLTKEGHTLPFYNSNHQLIKKDSIIKGMKTWKNWMLIEYNGNHYWIKADSSLLPYSDDENETITTQSVTIKESGETIPTSQSVTGEENEIDTILPPPNTTEEEEVQ